MEPSQQLRDCQVDKHLGPVSISHNSHAFICEHCSVLLAGPLSPVSNIFDSVKKDFDLSDGYHSFNQLYEFRLLYNAALFNEIHYTETQYGGTVKPVKSWKHSDGELAFGGGWFVVTAQLPKGQITNHYEEKDWNLFVIPEVDTAPEWDGHTPEDVATRLRAFIMEYDPRANGEPGEN